MKEDLRRFWEQPGKSFATTFLDGWSPSDRLGGQGAARDGQDAGGTPLGSAGVLRRDDLERADGGDQQSIKTMKRQAYGFRDLAFFKLKILAIHETRYALVG